MMAERVAIERCRSVSKGRSLFHGRHRSFTTPTQIGISTARLRQETDSRNRCRRKLLRPPRSYQSQIRVAGKRELFMELQYLQARSRSVKVESSRESARYPTTIVMKVMTAMAPNDTSTPIPATSRSLKIG